ncbi:MAG: hypothetical protein IPH76_09950 [Xanthomonadales bacterium]|nr:hypothetical protein [Xanthomonadales bacterium]
MQRRVTGTCTGTNYVRQVNADGTVTCGAAPAASGWSLTGDAGTSPATNFLGTTDAQPLVLRTGNVQSLRIEPSTELFEGNPMTANWIAGSRVNRALAGVQGATVAGGGFASASLEFSRNEVTDHYGSIGGGVGNQAGDGDGFLDDNLYATVGGGSRNIASGESSVVAGGIGNESRSAYAAIGGGGDNIARAQYSVVAGGFWNVAMGMFSVVPGGTGNCAGARYSMAAGSKAKVRPGTDPNDSYACSGISTLDGFGDRGTFVWADYQSNDFVSTGQNQFLIRAQNGVAINTNTPEVGAALTVAGNAVVQSPGALSFGQRPRQQDRLRADRCQ